MTSEPGLDHAAALEALVRAILNAPVHRHARRRSVDLFVPFHHIREAFDAAESLLPRCQHGHLEGACFECDPET